MDFEDVGFVIDNVGDQSVDPETATDSVVGNVFQQFLQEKLQNSMKSTPKNEKKLSSFEKFSSNMDFTIEEEPSTINKTTKKPSKTNIKTGKLNLDDMKKDVNQLQKVMAKSVVLKPGFDELKAIPSQVESDKRLKLKRKFEREKSKGKKWFNMPATELTEEVKKDLQVLQMRSVLDPKHFYKKNDLKVLPKYFQIGKVQDSPLEYYNNRLTKKERKRTLVDELLADAEFTKYNKKKYNEILVEKQKTHYKAHREAKRLKKKKK